MQTPPLPDLATRKALRAALLTFRRQAKIGFESMAKRYLLPSLPAEVTDSYDGEPLSAERVKRALHGWVKEDRDIARHPWILAAVDLMLREHGSPIVVNIAHPAEANRRTADALASFVVAPLAKSIEPLPKFSVDQSFRVLPGLYSAVANATVPLPDRCFISLHDIGLDDVLAAHHFEGREDSRGHFTTAWRNSGFLFLRAFPPQLLTRSMETSQFSAWTCYRTLEPNETALMRLATFSIEHAGLSQFGLVSSEDELLSRPSLASFTQSLDLELV